MIDASDIEGYQVRTSLNWSARTKSDARGNGLGTQSQGIYSHNINQTPPNSGGSVGKTFSSV
jgi:hypothetical protein